MAMIGKVLRMHRRDKKSVREIVKATSLARNTVRKYLRADRVEEPRRSRREEAPSKLAPFVEAIKQALIADARRPKKERRTANSLLKQIGEAGYDGGYSRLTDFIRAWRAQQGGVAIGKAFVPLAFELGEAFQFNWSEEGLVIGGIYRRLQVAHMKLCASRAFWLVAYPSQGHEMLFDAHTRSFAALGGVARRGIYDNMRTAVDKVLKGKGRVVNARFARARFSPPLTSTLGTLGDVWSVEREGCAEHRKHDAKSRHSPAEIHKWNGTHCATSKSVRSPLMKNHSDHGNGNQHHLRPEPPRQPAGPSELQP